ncbi:MAG: carbon-nitrogen hydrolase family protein [Sphingomonadaceae bacterium]
MTIGVVQTRTGLDANANARALADAVDRLAGRGATLVFTPEMCGLLDRDGARLARAAQTEDAEPTLEALRAVAAARRIAISVGSLAIRVPGVERLFNRGFAIGPDGAIRARYDKLHLFDVDLPDGQRYRESAGFAPGERLSVVRFDEAALGLAICYDLRFPALHAALARAGAEIIAQPAAFTVPTGEAHWHVLLRARAIETGCFIVAAAQAGRHADGRETYGHSLVVDPWGRVLLDMGTEPGEALAEIDLGEVARVRARIPSLEHARPLPAVEVVDARARVTA